MADRRESAVTVIQADLDAARAWWEASDELRVADAQKLAEAFARHRTAHRPQDLYRAIEIFESIGIIASGCATTHGDPGGGLEMINGYAAEGFQMLSTLTPEQSS